MSPPRSPLSPPPPAATTALETKEGKLDALSLGGNSGSSGSGGGAAHAEFFEFLFSWANETGLTESFPDAKTDEKGAVSVVQRQGPSLPLLLLLTIQRNLHSRVLCPQHLFDATQLPAIFAAYAQTLVQTALTRLGASSNDENALAWTNSVSGVLFPSFVVS